MSENIKPGVTVAPKPSLWLQIGMAATMIALTLACIGFIPIGWLVRIVCAFFMYGWDKADEFIDG